MAVAIAALSDSAFPDFGMVTNSSANAIISAESPLDSLPIIRIHPLVFSRLCNDFPLSITAAYFFTDGFGLYSEAGIPLAKYDSNVQGFEEYNNQFVFQIGASFNL